MTFLLFTKSFRGTCHVILKYNTRLVIIPPNYRRQGRSFIIKVFFTLYEICFKTLNTCKELFNCFFIQHQSLVSCDCVN